MKDVPVPRSRTPIGPHGCGQAGTRIYPWAGRPVAMRPDGHRQAGTRNHPFASRGHPRALMGTRKRREGCVARGKACRHRVGSIPGSDGKVHRFEGRARPCALIDGQIRRRAAPIPEEAAAFGALRYRHRREGRTRSPRCATRSERWASGSAVKGRPLSGEGCERQGQRPGYAPSHQCRHVQSMQAWSAHAPHV